MAVKTKSTTYKRRKSSIPKVSGGFVRSSPFRRSASRVAKSALEAAIAQSKKEIAFEGINAVGAKLAKEQVKRVIGANGQRIGATKQESFKRTLLDTKTVNSVTHSSTYYCYRAPQKLDDNRQMYIEKRAVKMEVSSSAGEQQYADFNILDVEPVLNNPGTNADWSKLTLKRAFDKALRPVMKIFDNSGVEQTVEQLETNTSLHFHNLTGELTIRLPSPCEITIYDLVPKFDLGPTTYYSETYAEGYMSPSWCFHEGVASANTMMLDDNYTSLKGRNPAARPTDSVTFTRTWDVIKETRVIAQDNSIHKHLFNYQINKSVPYQRMAQAATNGTKFAGWNPCVMIILKGIPDTINTDNLTTAASATVTGRYALTYSSNLNQNTKAIVYDSNT